MSKKFSMKQKNFLKTPLIASVSVIHSISNYPLIFPIWILEDDNKLYLTTEKSAKKVNHLIKTNMIGVNVTSPKGFPYLSISGDVKFIEPNNELFKDIRSKIFNKYDPDGSFGSRTTYQDMNDRVIIEITPKYIFGAV